MEGTYEYELERAELLGIEPPDREKWEEQNKARMEAQLEEVQNENAQNEILIEEKLKGNQGKMDELNSILSATQLKINKFKTVCGSFTTLLKIRTGSPAPEDRGSTSNEYPSTSINSALDDLDKMKEIERQSDVQFATEQVKDLTNKVSSNLSSLDRLIAKSEQAEISLNHQNQQMKTLLKK